MLSEGSAILVACSGGGDSVALLRALVALRDSFGWSLFVASIDHGLREASSDEVGWVGRLAESLGLPFVGRRIEVGSGNLQAEAREARYRALHAVREETGASVIATGHTLDDQAETVLSRVFRGRGIRSLRSIAPVREDGVVRPLIDVSRAAARGALDGWQQSFLEDPSNADERFERVRFRRLLATLEGEHPGIRAHLAQLSDEARGCAELLERGDMVEASRGDVSELKRLSPEARSLRIRDWASEVTGRSLGKRHVAQLADLVRNSRGEVLLGGGWRAIVDAGTLVFLESGAKGRSERE